MTRYVDLLATLIARRLSRWSPSRRAAVATMVATLLGVVGVTVTGDDAVVIATGIIYAAGAVVDAVTAWRAKRLEKRDDA